MACVGVGGEVVFGLSQASLRLFTFLQVNIEFV